MRNTIQIFLLKKAAEGKNPKLLAELRDKLQEAWGVTQNKTTYILNNTSPITVEQLHTAARVLGCAIEELIENPSHEPPTKASPKAKQPSG